MAEHPRLPFLHREIEDVAHGLAHREAGRNDVIAIAQAFALEVAQVEIRDSERSRFSVQEGGVRSVKTNGHDGIGQKALEPAFLQGTECQPSKIRKLQVIDGAALAQFGQGP